MYWLQLAVIVIGFGCILRRLKKMARQEDIDAIAGQLATVNEEIGGIADDMQLLKSKIEELNNNTPPEINLGELQELAASLVERTRNLNAENPAPVPNEPVPNEPLDEG